MGDRTKDRVRWQGGLAEDSDADFFSDVSVHAEPGALGDSEVEICRRETGVRSEPSTRDGRVPNREPVELEESKSELESEASSVPAWEQRPALTSEMEAFLGKPKSGLLEASAAVLERRAMAENTKAADRAALETTRRVEVSWVEEKPTKVYEPEVEAQLRASEAYIADS